MTPWMTMPAKHISLSSQKLYAHFDTQQDKTVCLHSQLNSQNRNELILTQEKCCHFRNIKKNLKMSSLTG